MTDKHEVADYLQHMYAREGQIDFEIHDIVDDFPNLSKMELSDRLVKLKHRNFHDLTLKRTATRGGRASTWHLQKFDPENPGYYFDRSKQTLATDA